MIRVAGLSVAGNTDFVGVCARTVDRKRLALDKLMSDRPQWTVRVPSERGKVQDINTVSVGIDASR